MNKPGGSPAVFGYFHIRSASSDPGGQGGLKFELTSKLSVGYQVNLSPAGASANPGITHPQIITWNGSRLEPIPISLRLVAGLSEAIPDSQTMIKLVERIYDFALPPRPGDSYLNSVIIAITTQGMSWFRAKGVLTSITSEFDTIYHRNGPMVVDVSMTFTPNTADAILKGREDTPPKISRPFRFNSVAIVGRR